MLEATPPSRNLQRPRLLIVDDDPCVRLMLTRILQTNQAWWEIHCAATGEQALELLSKEAYSAVIADLIMPGVNGLEVLSRTQKLQPEAVRLVHSSHNEMLESGRLGRLVHRALIKPASTMDVLALAGWALQQKSAGAWPFG